MKCYVIKYRRSPSQNEPTEYFAKGANSAEEARGELIRWMWKLGHDLLAEGSEPCFLYEIVSVREYEDIDDPTDPGFTINESGAVVINVPSE